MPPVAAISLPESGLPPSPSISTKLEASDSMSYTAPESINQASNSESSSSTETTYHTFRGKIASFLYMVPPLAASSTAEERLPLCSTTSSQDRNKRTLQVTPQSSSSESSPILTYTTHAPPTRPPTRLLPSLPEAYHSVPVPRARPGEASWLSRCRYAKINSKSKVEQRAP
jgi:hypothetical protein